MYKQVDEFVCLFFQLYWQFAMAPHKITYKAHTAHPIYASTIGFEKGFLAVARHYPMPGRISESVGHWIQPGAF